MAFDFATFGTQTVDPKSVPVPTPQTPVTPVQAPVKSSGKFDFNSFGSTNPSVVSTPTTQPVNTLDSQLSNMPGVLGAVGSGVYNAAKGVATLGGTAAYDVFSALNHPIDSGKALLSFLGGELTGQPVKTDAVGNLIQSTVGSKGLLGVAQLPGKVLDVALHPNDTSGVNNITAGGALGTGLNAALTALTFGTGNIAANAVEKSVANGYLSSTVGQALKTAATSQLGTAAQSGALMTGFNAASNLQEGRPIGEGAKQAFFSGAALPTIIKTTGKVINAVTPSALTNEAGAIDLKKAVGFRGNIKEKTQYDNAVPVVYDTLKNEGFKLTDSTDPNNLVNLDKAIQDKMTSILAERTSRIQATGGDATVSGDLAANKIRNLVEPGSIEDLTNPSLREKLDAIASNFEGKKYNPVDAQKAIVQANTGFSFSDNPVIGKQIKMAISQAFTPELDRIVGGTDAIAYDAKGKPIPVKGGTAELSKQWSAFKSFSDQLQKKMIIEERKATYDLPTRLTGAQIAGKVGEAVGNPLIIPQKIAGAGLEYLANKILGDRNNVNYRIYQAFNRQPIGEAVINILNKFTKVQDLVKLLEQNPLIQNVLEKIYPPENTLQAQENPALMRERSRGFAKIGSDSVSKDTSLLAKEAQKYSSAEEFVKAKFNKPSYGMSHRPSYDGMPPASNLLEGDALPKDVYTHPDFSISSGAIRRGDKSALESWDALQKIRNKPDATITIYRATPKNELNTGDWVTLSKNYAKDSVEPNSGETVHSFKVKASDVIFAGDDINEFGYYPKSQLTDLYNKVTNKK